MQTKILTFENAHRYGELLPNFFRARKRAFIEDLGWDLPQIRGLEYDQYDTPASMWLVNHIGNTVYSGARLTPTTHNLPNVTYMIKDAQEGRLDSLPTDLLYDAAPVSDKYWELTRTFIDRDTPRELRIEARTRTVNAAILAAKLLDLDGLIAITPGNWPRWYRMMGIKAEAIGPMMQMGDGKYQCVRLFTPKKVETNGKNSLTFEYA